MDRFMLHLKNTKYTPKDATMLLEKARHLSSELDSIIRDTRVSSKYIEYDVSIKKENLDKLVEKLNSISDLDHAKHVVEESLEKNEAIKMGVSYFNGERFWEAHEVLEGVWKNCYEGEKDLIQGIILVAAALVHYQKDEDNICISILDRALQKLSRADGAYNGINIDRLRKKIQEIKDTKKITTFTI